VRYDHFMPTARAGVWRALPILLLLALYWPGVTTWFYQDDFGWLNLRHDVHSVRDLGAALFAPKAHGNMRPLGENAYWLGLSAIFGAEALPFHIAAFLTQSASLLLLGGIVRRLTNSRVAAFAAQLIWMVNIGLAPALGWSSIYNQILSGFFLLLAFHFLLRRQMAAQWIAFLLGLGALEINVVYPALAAAYAVLYDRPLLKKTLPMFAVSALSVLAHFHFAPPPASGVYAPHLDARLPATIWTYWAWSLGPMPVWLTILLTVAVIALAVAALRRREPLALLALAWFAFPLLPYLPLPEHKMDYYLAVPAIGLALLGAAGIAQARWRIPAGVCLLVYLGASLPAASTITRWQHARGERVEDLVLGVREIRQSVSEPILIDGIDTELFWSGIADLPFRALSIPRVYLTPTPATRIQAAPELLSKYTLPEALARPAVLYRFDGSLLHRATLPAWGESEPHFVNLADDVFVEYFGDGWQRAPGGYRTMSGTASVRIGAPRTAAEALFIGIFETRDIRLGVRADGVDLPVTMVHRDNDLSEYRATLPAAALSRKVMNVTVTADRAPLTFGYLEVR
jgi:hypothetical protein